MDSIILWFRTSGRRIGWGLIALSIIYIFVTCGAEPKRGSVTTVNKQSSGYSSSESKKSQDLNKEFLVASQGFWKGLGATRGHMFDPSLASAIVEFLKKEEALTVLELGAGMGLYSKQIKSQGLLTSCYDGNPDTQTLSEGRCGVIDLSRPLEFSKHDWVLSLEVGEHIPKDFETTFLSNLVQGNRIGVILSWAVEGQGGTSHVNNRNKTL